jgi:hypothetical protein
MAPRSRTRLLLLLLQALALPGSRSFNPALRRGAEQRAAATREIDAAVRAATAEHTTRKAAAAWRPGQPRPEFEVPIAAERAAEQELCR